MQSILQGVSSIVRWQLQTSLSETHTVVCQAPWAIFLIARNLVLVHPLWAWSLTYRTGRTAAV